MLKVVATVLIGVMILMFLIIGVSTKDQKQYTWVWFSIEAVYIVSLFAIWG